MNYYPYIYIIDYQSNFINYLPPIPASYPYKMKYLFVMEVLEQPGSGTRVDNVMVIRELRHPHMDKQRKLLAKLMLHRQRCSLDHMTLQCFASRNARS